MLYRPSLSLTTLRTFSISAGLEASTVTPGSTAPELSLMSPAIPLAVACCADAARGSSSAQTMTVRPTPTTLVLTMDFLLLPHPLASLRVADATCTLRSQHFLRSRGQSPKPT